jgi:hypothetical protein
LNENNILVILSGWMKNDFADWKLSAAHSLVKTALVSKLYIFNLQHPVMMLSALRISTEVITDEKQKGRIRRQRCKG